MRFYVDALLSVGNIACVAQNVPRPYVCNMSFSLQPRTTTPLLTAKQLQDMGHMGDAWDVAYACLYLASDEAKYVTGIELIVDGGITLKCN